MFSFDFASRHSLRPLFAPAALLTLLAAGGLAHAQTAPTLLPYTAKLIAGGGTAAIASGGTCPVSGNISTDAYGDGCLATEIQLTAPRDAIADASGNVFFSDYTNGLVRRVDAISGIVTLIAGGASSSPAAGSACGTGLSTDARGDGCPATAVKLSHPAALAFSPAGDLYIADPGYSEVRKLTAVAGVVSGAGTISLVAGSPATTYGYTSNFGTTTINAATSSFLDAPFGLAFDPAGNLYIADEYKNAVLVVNTNATTTTVVTGVSIPPGTIAKIAGSISAGGTVCPNSPATTNGCNYGVYKAPSPANSTLIDSPYAVAFDPAGNVYFSNEYDADIAKIDPTGTLNNYAGIPSSAGKVLKRAVSGTFAVGSSFGVAADATSNVYFTDASNGVVWRIDNGTMNSYVVAGGGAVCAAATDANGDGCPATQAKFGSSGTTFATSAAGIFGVTVDASENLYVGDTVTNVIREIASGTQFGAVGANRPTQTVAIHFAASDLPASGAPYTLTAGAANFSLGTATCTTNSDATTDCLLPVTATPATLGAFTGTLKVTSSLGATASFPLSGTYINSPLTTTTVAASSTASTGCGTGGAFAVGTPITLTASVVSTGTPTGTITFFSNGTMIGTAQPIASGAATLKYTFATAGTFKITATYSGDSYFKPSTTVTSATVITSAPGFTAAVSTNQQSTVIAGQTALYALNLTANVYTGTIQLSCSGLPAYSTCQFSPATIVATGCSVTNTVALSILTTQATQVIPASFAPGAGRWTLLGVIPGFALALLIGLRRRSFAAGISRFGMLLALALIASGLAACGSGTPLQAPTPAGTYTVTVNLSGSDGTTATTTVPLTVH